MHSSLQIYSDLDKMVTDFDSSSFIQIVLSNMNQWFSTLLSWRALISKLPKSGAYFGHENSFFSYALLLESEWIWMSLEVLFV